MSDDSIRKLVVIGPNPAVDITIDLDGFVPGEVHRSAAALKVAGGKPVNVARNATRLGAGVRLVSPLGGPAGAIVAQSVTQLGVDVWSVPVRAETRNAYIIVDRASRHSTVINEWGPELTPHEARSYEVLCLSAVEGASLVTASGSLPRGLEPDFYARIAEHARSLGIRCVVDTSGNALHSVSSAEPWCIKVNGEELMHVSDNPDPVLAARALVERGVQHVVVTLGAQGALHVCRSEANRVNAAPIDVVNAVAAGDAFLAGLLVGLLRADGWPEAMRLASAAACIVAGQMGPDIGPNPPIRDVMQRVDVMPAPVVSGTETIGTPH